jgi:hypothetical protein
MLRSEAVDTGLKRKETAATKGRLRKRFLRLVVSGWQLVMKFLRVLETLTLALLQCAQRER